MEAEFDATPWFEQASPADIINLAECGWGGDYAADSVAEYMDKMIPDVTDMFTYIRLRQKKSPVGFECHVERESAMQWLEKNKPSLFLKISENGS